jgi:hypothetical protein
LNTSKFILIAAMPRSGSKPAQKKNGMPCIAQQLPFQMKIIVIQ